MYCIVYELSRVNKSGCFAFDGGFPFTLLAAASVIPVEVIEPWVLLLRPVKLCAVTYCRCNAGATRGRGRPQRAAQALGSSVLYSHGPTSFPRSCCILWPSASGCCRRRCACVGGCRGEAERLGHELCARGAACIAQQAQLGRSVSMGRESVDGPSLSFSRVLSLDVEKQRCDD